MSARPRIAVVLALAFLSSCGGGPSDDPVYRSTMDAVNACQRQVGFDEKHFMRKLMRCVHHRLSRSSRPDE